MTIVGLTEEYLAAVKRPAEVVHDFHQEGTPLELLDGRAVVIPHLLSAKECDDLIATTEDHGIFPPELGTGSGRSAKRTRLYVDETLSKKVAPRIEPVVVAKFEENKEKDAYLGPFTGIHSNWRVLRYDPGDSFPAHQDQMDSFQQRNANGTKDLIVSSHTLLINLSKEDQVQGGATRFYPRAKVRGSTAGQYTEAVDVILPRGWALVFQQKGLVHCGQPVLSGHKYVAQAGVLRKLPKGKLFQPSVFRLGPGVNALANEAEAKMREDSEASKAIEGRKHFETRIKV